MKKKINYSEFIERYLDGEMSPDEKLWFEKEIAGNRELDNEVRLRSRVNKAIGEDDVIQLRRQLDEIHAVWERKNSRRRISRSVFLRTAVAAASLIVLVVAGWFAMNVWQRTYTHEEVFTMYYEPYDMPSYRDGNSPADEIFRQALLTYQNRDFEKAIVLFEQVLGRDSLKMDANLMSGISKIETERYGEANQNFRSIIDHRDNLFIEQAQWYLGLSYLMAGEPELAVEMFGFISETEGFYRKKAAKVLKMIR